MEDKEYFVENMEKIKLAKDQNIILLIASGVLIGLLLFTGCSTLKISRDDKGNITKVEGKGLGMIKGEDSEYDARLKLIDFNLFKK